MMIFILSALIAAFSIYMLIPFAAVLGLLDVPGGRKQHIASTPLVGGLGVFVTLIFIVGFYPIYQHLSFFAACAIIVAIGLLDDRKPMAPNKRLLLQLLAALLCLLEPNAWLLQLGNVMGFGVLGLNVFSPLLTVVALLSMTNAFNMQDGIDGLAALLALIGFGGCFWLMPNDTLSPVLMAVMGSLVAFLFFNLKPANSQQKIFLGDAGSLLLGFMAAWFSIYLTQQPDSSIYPVTLLYLFALPLYDFLAIIIYRLCTGKHPAKASRDHFHHRLMSVGLSSRKTLMVEATLALIIALLGITGQTLFWQEYYLFYLFLLGFIVYYYVVHRLLKNNAKSL